MTIFIGDAMNPGTTNFVIKEFKVSNGASFNNQDGTSNCVPNCYIYTSDGYCIAC